MCATVEGNGEKHRRLVLTSRKWNAGGIIWQARAVPATGREMWELWGDASASSKGYSHFFQPEWGGKDRWGAKFSWTVVMQQTPHISSSSIYWAASCWPCLSPPQVLWILFGGWLYVTGSGPGFPGCRTIFTRADRVPKATRSVAMGEALVWCPLR